MRHETWLCMLQGRRFRRYGRRILFWGLGAVRTFLNASHVALSRGGKQALRCSLRFRPGVLAPEPCCSSPSPSVPAGAS